MHHPSQCHPALSWPIVLSCLLIGLGVWVTTSTVQGVPIPIVLQFLADQPARDAYFEGDKQALHDRLNHLGVEEAIKAYYRPQFPNEDQLDQHIHQIFYDNTGYVGKGYEVGLEGTLIPIDLQFERWYRLATRAGIVSDRLYRDGVQYVVAPTGEVAPYQEIATIYSKKLLRRLIRLQKQSLVNGQLIC